MATPTPTALGDFALTPPVELDLPNTTLSGFLHFTATIFLMEALTSLFNSYFHNSLTILSCIPSIHGRLRVPDSFSFHFI